MQKKYSAPNLELAGEADEVVFGGGGGGFDYYSEYTLDGGQLRDDLPEEENAK
jgi:hypothetical protein